MTQKRKIQSDNIATALTQSNLETVANYDDATAPVPSAPARRKHDSGIIAASGRIKRIDPATNIVVSLGERETEQGLELKVYHRVDDRVGTYFTAILGDEGNGYTKAGRFFAEQMLGSKVKSYTIVSDAPVAPSGETEYSPLSKDKVYLFKRALDERINRP